MISTMLATISGNQLLEAAITVVVVGIICWLLWWLIAYCALPDPFNKLARILVAIFAVFFLINIILSLAGHPIVTWR